MRDGRPLGVHPLPRTCRYSGPKGLFPRDRPATPGAPSLKENEVAPLRQFQILSACGKTALSEPRKNALRCDGCGFVYFHNARQRPPPSSRREKGIILTVRAEEPKKGGMICRRVSWITGILGASVDAGGSGRTGPGNPKFRYLGSFPIFIPIRE